MKLMKSALLGTAAGFVAMAGAQAADLPSRKAAPVEYVKVCDVYGAGFFYIPGTDTCLKIGGRVRFEMQHHPVKNMWRSPSSGGAYGTGAANYTSKNGIDSLGWNARGYLYMDARTQSAWGTVQTVITMRVNSASGSMALGHAGTTAGNGFTPTLEAAYVRFAGFTFGRAVANFTTMPPFIWNTEYYGGYGAGIKQLAYTATFGGGFSATLALEDRADKGASVTANALGSLNGCPLVNPVCVPVSSTATAVGPNRLPALVGNLRLDQGWGMIQLSGSVVQNTANFATPAALAVANAHGPVMTSTGWAVARGGRIKVPGLAQGSRFDWTVGYTKGNLDESIPTSLNGNTPKNNGSFLTGYMRSDRNMTIFECGPAGAFVGCSENTKAWNIAGLLTHYWTPSLRSHFSASYTQVTPGTVTQNTDWSQGGLGKAKAWHAAGNLIWSPVRGFDIGLELAYARLNQRLPGLLGGLPLAVTNPAAVGNIRVNPSNYVVRMRVERTF